MAPGGPRAHVLVSQLGCESPDLCLPIPRVGLRLLGGPRCGALQQMFNAGPGSLGPVPRAGVRCGLTGSLVQCRLGLQRGSGSPACGPDPAHGLRVYTAQGRRVAPYVFTWERKRMRETWPFRGNGCPSRGLGLWVHRDHSADALALPRSRALSPDPHEGGGPRMQQHQGPEGTSEASWFRGLSEPFQFVIPSYRKSSVGGVCAQHLH